ncbi:MAG: MinD/ParA family protein, partial [Planctomycetota bacterium]
VRRAGCVLADPRVPHAVRRRVHFRLAYPSCPASSCVREIASTLGFERSGSAPGEGFFRRMTSLLRGNGGLPSRSQTP